MRRGRFAALKAKTVGRRPILTEAEKNGSGRVHLAGRA